MSKSEDVKWAFRPNVSVGAASAEFDPFLDEAFWDSGYVEALRNTTDHKCIVVGRTGSGKSALLLTLARRVQRAISLSPEQLSLQYISNSTIIPYLQEIGVRLDPFYKLLWRHVLAVEILRHWTDLHNEEQSSSLISLIGKALSKARRDEEDALRYLRVWGDKFWEPIERRVQDVTQTFERKVEAAGGIKAGALSLGASKAGTLTTSERAEYQERAQGVVNEIQMSNLVKLNEILQKVVLSDPQNPFHIVIDDLDKDWVDAAYRLDLTLALLEVAAAFAKMENVKVIVALRENIIDQLMNHAHVSGQQREKFEDLFLRITWTGQQLEQMLDRRVKAMMRGQYGQQASLSAILPAKGKSENLKRPFEYMLERSLYRPRDLITFLNTILQKAEGSGRATWDDITSAEEGYSRERKRSLLDEWDKNYPGLTTIVDLFVERVDEFTLNDFMEWGAVEDLLVVGEKASDPLSIARFSFRAWEEGKADEREIASLVLKMVYRTGLVGVRLYANDPVVFSHDRSDALEATSIRPNSRFYIHPMFYRALATKNPARGSRAKAK